MMEFVDRSPYGSCVRRHTKNGARRYRLLANRPPLEGFQSRCYPRDDHRVYTVEDGAEDGRKILTPIPRLLGEGSDEYELIDPENTVRMEPRWTALPYELAFRIARLVVARALLDHRLASWLELSSLDRCVMAWSVRAFALPLPPVWRRPSRARFERTLPVMARNLARTACALEGIYDECLTLHLASARMPVFRFAPDFHMPETILELSSPFAVADGSIEEADATPDDDEPAQTFQVARNGALASSLVMYMDCGVDREGFSTSCRVVPSFLVFKTCTCHREQWTALVDLLRYKWPALQLFQCRPSWLGATPATSPATSDEDQDEEEGGTALTWDTDDDASHVGGHVEWDVAEEDFVLYKL